MVEADVESPTNSKDRVMYACESRFAKCHMMRLGINWIAQRGARIIIIAVHIASTPNQLTSELAD